jgi:hypothetical protein
MIAYKKKSLIKTFFSIVLIVSTMFYITIPAFKNVKEKNSQISDQLFTADQLLQKGQTVNKLGEDIERIKPFLDKLDSVFIKPDEELDFIISLEELGELKGVESHLSINDIPDENGIIDVPIALSANGAFENTLNYLIALQQLNFYINIKSISISSPASNSLETSLRGFTYWNN